MGCIRFIRWQGICFFPLNEKNECFGSESLKWEAMYIFLLFLRLRDFPGYGTVTAKTGTILGKQASWSPSVAFPTNTLQIPFTPLSYSGKEVRALKLKFCKTWSRFGGVSHLKCHKEELAMFFWSYLWQKEFSVIEGKHIIPFFICKTPLESYFECLFIGCLPWYFSKYL